MSKYVILYNPKSANGTGEKGAKKCADALRDSETRLVDITKISYPDFFSGIAEDEKLIVAGGDGTLNRFVNDSEGLYKTRAVYYFPAGTGNDFLRDLEKLGIEEPIEITEYLKDLPNVTVNGSTKKFINGVGYGIDGYCCEVGDSLVGKSDKPVNYAGIAIKGLLFHYRPTRATVTVDGQTKNYDYVWLSPTMNGRFYGGGMMPTPNQSRNSDTVSVMVWHNRGRLSTLAAFPAIFKGEHVKNRKMIEILSGKNIRVAFDRPVALQIDGETILGVSEYSVSR